MPAEKPRAWDIGLSPEAGPPQAEEVFSVVHRAGLPGKVAALP